MREFAKPILISPGAMRGILVVLLIFFPRIAVTDDDLVRADAFFAGNRYADAAGNYQRALAADPKNARAYAGMGLSLNELGRTKEALQYCLKSVASAPSGPEGYFCTGIILGGRGEYEKALESFSKAVQIDPYYPEAYFNIGVCDWHQGQYAKAADAYERFFEVHPGLETARFVVGSFEMPDDDYRREMEACRAAIRENPLDAGNYQSLGIVYLRLNKPGKAVAFFMQAAALSKGNAKATYNWAIACQRAGDGPCALENFKKATVLDPKYGFILARELSERKRLSFDGEAGCRQKSVPVSVYAGFADAHYNLGRIDCRQKNWEHLRGEIAALEELSRFDLSEDLKKCRP